MNSQSTFLFTVDVEDWFQVENLKAAIPFESWDQRELRVEKNTHRILDLLDEFGAKVTTRSQHPVTASQDIGDGLNAPATQVPNQTNKTNKPNKLNKPNEPNEPNMPNSTSPPVRATFFVLGWIAEKLPTLVKVIHSRGHEIASHGLDHRLCSMQTFDALRDDLAASKALLEDLIGVEVQGYRAPSFSVDDAILRVIEACGYRYDASFNSFDKHGRYGRLSINGFKKRGIAYQVTDTFYELPVSNINLQPSTFNLNPVVIPWCGGGYFRLIPYVVFKRGIKHILATESTYHFYVHPWELDPGQPRVRNIPALSAFRHTVNLSSAADKIKRMLSDFGYCRFMTCGEYISQL